MLCRSAIFKRKVSNCKSVQKVAQQPSGAVTLELPQMCPFMLRAHRFFYRKSLDTYVEHNLLPGIGGQFYNVIDEELRMGQILKWYPALH